MTERELRDGLHIAVADEPPLDFDPDRLLARVHRDARRRRALVGAVAATAVIATVTATSLSHDAQSNVAALHRAPSTSVRPPIDVVQYSKTRELQLAAAWTAHLITVFPSVVPAAQQVTVRPWGGEAEGQIEANQNYLDSFVTFTIDNTPTAIDINVQAPGHDTDDPHRCQQPCDVTTWADGTVLTVATTKQAQLQVVTVSEFRTDGSVVFASGYNYDPTSPSGPHTSQHVLVDVDQLTRLATDPALAFKP